MAGRLAAGGAPGFGVALAGRLVSGAGARLLIVALPTIIADRFAGTALPAAMGTLLAGYPLGIGLGFVALPLVGSWRLLAPERRAVGMGLFWLCFFVPMPLLPPLAGLARDLTGDPAAPLGAAAAYAALGLLALAIHAGLRRPMITAGGAPH